MGSIEAPGDRLTFPPRWTLGGLTGSRLLLAQTAGLVATVDHFEAWPQGVRFTVSVQTKGLNWTPGSMRGPIVFGWDPKHDRDRAPGVFELEITYPGRPAAHLSFEGGAHTGDHDDGGDPVVTILGGNGNVDEQDLGRWETRFWLTPLPPVGSTVRCTWAVGDIDETASFDIDALNAAASEASVVPE